MSFVFVYVPKPRFVIAGSPVAGCGPYGFHMRAVGPAIGNRAARNCKTKFYYKHNDILHVPEE